MIELTARLRFLVRNDHDALARRDCRQQIRRGFRIVDAIEQRGRDDRGAQVWLQHESFTERIHHQHRVDRARAQSAMLFGHVQRSQAETGELSPQLAAPAVLRLQDLAPRLERIVLAHEAPHGVGEQLLFIGEIEIHE